VAVVSVGQVSQDYERKGFFRIGLLPIRIGEEVTIEVRDPAALAHILSSLPGNLTRSLQGTPAELRRFTLSLRGEATTRLTAERVRFAPDGTWLLLGNVTVGGGPALPRTHQARLQVNGPAAGLVRLDSPAGPRHIPLLAGQDLPPPGQPTSSLNPNPP
jgi:hypothetical protein